MQDPRSLSQLINGDDDAASLAAARALRDGDRPPVIVSACLLGAPTRFDGAAKRTDAVEAATLGRTVLPLCPELLGGLGCPRAPIHFQDGDGGDLLSGAGAARALDDGGQDRGGALVAGARRALSLAMAAGAREAILKERSPSCGCTQVHTDRGVVAGRGVFAALAMQAGLTCRSEEDSLAAHGPRRPAMDTNYYDVIVCGGELTGLIAAALLGRRGLRVLLVGHDANHPTFEAGGITLARAPALLPPLDSPPVARALKELNCVQVVHRRAPAISPGFQVAFPKHRFDVGASDELLRRELDREWRGDAETIAAVTRNLAATSAIIEPLLGSEVTLPPDGFWERREVGRLESLLPKPGTDLLAPLPANHPWRAAVAAPAVLAGAFGPNDVGTVSQARAFDLARRGLHRLEGGYAALHALFLEKLGNSSGEKREKLTPIEIVQKRGKAVGIRFRPRDETIGAEHLIWAGPARTMLSLCGDKARSKGREAGGGLQVACYRYGLAMLVAPEAIPEGMGSRVFLIADPGRPLLEENAIAVTVGQSAPRDAGRIPIWAECLVPAPAVDGSPGYLRTVRGRVRKQLAKLMPFFTQHLVILASPYDGLPPEIPGQTGNPPVAVPPLPMLPVYSAEASRPLDVAGLPHATGIKNLYLAGRENLPGLGVEGEFVSAWGVARLITGTQPKRDRHREVLLNEG